jgi:hypothetical protein
MRILESIRKEKPDLHASLLKTISEDHRLEYLCERRSSHLNVSPRIMVNGFKSLLDPYVEHVRPAPVRSTRGRSQRNRPGSDLSLLMGSKITPVITGSVDMLRQINLAFRHERQRQSWISPADVLWESWESCKTKWTTMTDISPAYFRAWARVQRSRICNCRKSITRYNHEYAIGA